MKDLFKEENYDRIFGYIWSETHNDNESKFGQTFVLELQNPLIECKKRIRESLGVRKDKFDNNEVIIHAIIDLSEYAKSNKIFGVKSKVDDHIRKKVGFVKQGEVHNISGEKLYEKISDYLSKSLSKFKPIFTPRFHQELVTEEFLYKLEKNKGDKIDFALELAPRFGKTMFAIHLIQKLFNDYGYKICFLPNYILSATSSFKDDFNKFHGYSENMILVEDPLLLEKTIKENYGEKMIIVALSLHMNNYEEKLKIVKELPSNEKMIVADETDQGTHTLDSQKLIEFLDCKLNIYMSGTGIERIVKICKNLGDNIIQFCYNDILLLQSGQHPIQALFI
jgi:hypothetical protein